MTGLTAFVLSHQLAFVAAAIGLAVLAAALHACDARRAERKRTDRIAAYVKVLGEDEIDEILTGTDRRQP